MHAPKRNPHIRRISDLCLGASRLIALFLVVSVVPLATPGSSVKAAEEAAADHPGQAPAKADALAETGSAPSAPTVKLQVQTMLWATTAWLPAIV